MGGGELTRCWPCCLPLRRITPSTTAGGPAREAESRVCKAGHFLPGHFVAQLFISASAVLALHYLRTALGNL